MAFESLGKKIQNALKKLKGKPKLKEDDIDLMLKEVRLSLLEADVNFRVVKQFLNNVKEKAIGRKILEGLDPSQMVVDIVREELIDILGKDYIPLNFNNSKLSIFILVGLQGAGKTTLCGKLALMSRKKFKKKVMISACDVYRPAAIDQLVTLGKQIDIPVFSMGQIDPREILKNSIEEAKRKNIDLLIVDTAGRLSINDELMKELSDLKEISNPDEILLSVDAMSGQEAVNVCNTFNDYLKLSGIVLTKMDGDSRGGACLSIKYLTNLNVKLVSNGERLDDLDTFYPDRIAERILGMGDILSLIDSVKENIEEEEMKSMQDRLLAGLFNYNDLLKQLKMIKRLGSFSKIMGFLPGMGKIKEMASMVDEKNFEKVEVLINSMTQGERKNPYLIENSVSRRKRISSGSGLGLDELNKLRQMYSQIKQISQKLKGMSEEDMAKYASNLSNLDPNSFKKSKGKGKNKGGFRF